MISNVIVGNTSSSKPNITTVPPEWFQSLLRVEGVSTLNNTTDRTVFFFIFGEMNDLQVPINTTVPSRYYKLKIVNLDADCQTEINFPSQTVKVVVGYYHNDKNRENSSITTIIQKTLQQSHTFNVLERHLTNDDPLKGLQTIYKNFKEFEQFLIDHENDGNQFLELPTDY